MAVNGGQTEDGFPIRGLGLSNDMRIVEYYYTYGLALARTDQLERRYRSHRRFKRKSVWMKTQRNSLMMP